MNVKKLQESSSAKQFTVVMRGPSALIFPEGRAFGFNDFPSPLGPIRVSYTSRWLTLPNSVRMPGQLWIEVNGSGPDFETTIPVLANAALAGLPLMSVACNAAIQDPDLELAFESTVGATQREFFQAYVRPESNHVSSARLADPDGIARLTDAVAASEYRDRLLRACDQYRLALDSWKVGRESLTLAHLWMALEALTKIQLEELKQAFAVKSNGQLAEKLQLNDVKALDGVIRQRYLLDDDEDCYRKSKAASDGFEHGFLGFDTIRFHAADVRERLARYIRADILRLARVPQGTVDVLIAPPYAQPLGSWPLIKFITGTLEGSAPDLAKTGNAYPIIRWQQSIKTLEFSPVGKMTVQFQENMRAELGDGIRLIPGTLQVWEGGSGVQLKVSPEVLATAQPIEIEPSETISASGNVIVAVDDPNCAKWAHPLGSFALNCNAIRHLAVFWPQALTGKPAYQRKPVAFAKAVRRLMRLVRQRGVPKSLQEACQTAWNEAIALDQVRVELCSGAAMPEGLVLFDQRKRANAPIANDVQRLVELNSKVISVAKKLHKLLSELQELPMFSRRSAD